MKFDKFLKHTQATFTEPILQESILPYKYWKKYIKQHKSRDQGDMMDSQEILQKLQAQCHKTDHTFQTELNLKLHPSSWCDTILCFAKMKNKIQIETATDKELVTFSEINQQALYKICKKLQKNGALDLMRFYTEAKTKRTFKFLGNHERMYLKLQLHSHQEAPPECPICMEEESLPLVILDCEHYLCLTCLMHMTRVTQRKGTLYNRLIMAGVNLSCPVCRQYNPLSTVDKYHFYPTEPKNTLNA